MSAMQRHDIEVLEHAAQWMRDGQRAALVTVLGTYGASPRPPGSMALIRSDGRVVGSISGGCVEDELVERIARGTLLDDAAPVQLLSFGADAQERERLGLPCGNSLRVAIETRLNLDHLADLLEAVRQQQVVLRRVRYDSGEASHRPARADDVFQDDGLGFCSVLGPTHRLLIIGASELGRYLANLMLTLDDAVTVCDPRQEHLQGWAVPGVTLLRSMPDDAVAAFACDSRTAVVAVTHDPKLDDLALMEALRQPCYYVGALGSERTNETRRQRLKLFDLNQNEVDRLHGPVGIRIGSRTPAEIAVSIAADLIAERRRRAVMPTPQRCQAAPPTAPPTAQPMEVTPT